MRAIDLRKRYKSNENAFSKVSTGWIPTADRLPNDGQIVMIVFDTSNSDWYKYPTNMQLAEYTTKWGFRDKASLNYLNNSMITHWHPIPVSPYMP